MKKLYFLLIFSFFLSKANAQWVTIPDPNFVIFLQQNYPQCMNGNQMNTSCNAIANETYIDCRFQNISDLMGIQYFINLQYLDCSENYWLLFPTLPNSLKTLIVRGNNSGNINNLPDSLIYLDCAGHDINLLPTLPSTLTYLNCASNDLVILPTLPDSLVYLICNNNNLISLPSLPPKLKSLIINDNELTSLPILPNKISIINCNNNQLTTISNIPDSLKYFYCKNNLMTSLPVMSTVLDTLECSINQLSSLPNLPNSLKVINCATNQLNSLPALPFNLTILNCSVNNITSLPLLPNNLSILNCTGNDLSSLPQLPLNLKELFCNYNLINALPVLPNNLQVLNCTHNYLSSLPALPDSLQYLYCYYNQITSIPQLKNSLIKLYCYNNQINSFTGSLPNSLKELKCEFNQLSSLPMLPNSLELLVCRFNQLSLLPPLPNSLVYLNCSANPLDSLPELPNSLKTLHCGDTPIISLPQLPSYLEDLAVDGNNQLTTLPSLPNTLRFLHCINGQITHLPELPDTLNSLVIFNNPNLTCLPLLKNINFLNFMNTAVECIPNIGNIGSSYPSLTSIPICDIFNQNNCDVYWNIKGEIYHDQNNNCLADTMESSFINLKVQLFKNSNLIQQVYSAGDGSYSFDTDTGTFTYTVDTTDIPVYIICPVSGFHTSILTPADSMDSNMYFAMECKPGFDVGVKNIVRTSGQLFPANYATIKIGAGDMANFYGLNCATGVSGAVTININGPVTYISEAPGALIPVVSGNTILTYNISDFGTVNFNSDFRFIVQTDTIAQAGSIICFSVNVTPIAGDNDTTNNSLQHCFTVVNSFDPNDKQVFPSGVLLPDHEWLTFTIRFQNTGTAPAQHIYILDTLDVNLDVSTFTLLSYSHDNLTQVIDDVVKFNFPNINLPDSTNDEPNSHGYVQYKIKLNPGLPVGTTISNTAYNFFDFNPPVATNTVVNQIYFLNPTITPNNLILCPNESDTLWTQVYDSYQWFKDGNIIPGATQQFLVVDYFNDAGSQFIVEVDSAGVIAQSAPVLVDGWAFLPPFVIQEGDFTIGPLGEMILCPGDTAYLILGLPYDTNIQWTDNGVAITGANDDTLIVTQAGLFNVSGSPSQCPNYVQSLFDDIQVVIAPPLTPTITPNNLILCPNESDTLFTQVFGSYQWYKDGNLIPGATNQYLVVDAFNDAGSQFSVEVTQGNCTGTSSQVLVDGWAFLPPFVISEGDFTVGPNGEMLVCPGDTAYLILGLPYDTNIQWTNNLNIIPGATDDTLVVTQSGMYHVSGAPSVCPNFIQNLGVTIEVIVQGPPMPTIIQVGNTLVVSQSGFDYQWFYEGTPVGSNSQTLLIQGWGNYSVIITDANGCTADVTIPVFGDAIIENSVSGVVNVNYNSQTSTLQITRSNTTAETEIFVSDVLGRVIADEKMPGGISEIEIKLNNIKPGIYFVNLSESGTVKFFVE